MPLTDEMRAAILATQCASGRSRADNRRIHNKAYRNGLVSQTAGCHPSQVKKFNKVLDKERITESRFKADGSLFIASRQDRKRICEIWNRVDADGGYGDRTQFSK